LLCGVAQQIKNLQSKIEITFMPFQDIEEVSEANVPRSPSTVERVLRRVFVEDWGLKLIALAISLALWMAVTGQNTPVTIRPTVQLNFIRPSGLDISNDPPKNVEVLLTGSRAKLEGISSLDLVAKLDLSDMRAGEKLVRLSRSTVNMDLPDGVTIDSFNPGTIPVKLEPRIQQQVNVDVRLEGQPAKGFEVYGVHPASATVTLIGPASHVNALQKVATESISVEGKNASFTISDVALDVPDHKVDLPDSDIDVTIEIGEHRVEKSFNRVPVQSTNGTTPQPLTANVTLQGPATAIAQLRPEDIKIVLEVGPNGVISTRVEVPAALQNLIKLLSTSPSQFTVSR
jgi:YbbR domain-containing protein